MSSRNDVGPECNTARRLFWERCASRSPRTYRYSGYDGDPDYETYEESEDVASWADYMLIEWDKRWIVEASKDEMISGENEDSESLKPEWIINNIGELGVKVGSRFYFLYKGYSLEYKDDGGPPMKWRPVYKREFGEVCHPPSFTSHEEWKKTIDQDEWFDLTYPNIDKNKVR